MTGPRIALVCFSPLRTGGVETHLLQIMEGMSSDFDFLVVGDSQEPFATQAREHGAKVLPFHPSGKYDLAAIPRLQEVFRQNEIALVHTHEARAGLLGRIAARLAGRISLHTVHTPAFFLARGRGATWAYQRVEGLLNRWGSDGVVFVSPTIRDLYSQLGLVSSRKAFLIPNGLASDWFRPQGERRPSPGACFLYVGRLAIEKDLPNLMEAFSRMAPDHPGSCLRIAGSGPLRDELERMVSQGPLEGRVEFLGSLSSQAVRGAVRDSDVFVLPSRYESMSYTLLEAMACGLACIATDVGGNRDLIVNGVSGILVPRGSALALESAMRSIAGSPVLRRELGRAARETASQYTVEKMLQLTRGLYLSLLAAQPLHRKQCRDL